MDSESQNTAGGIVVDGLKKSDLIKLVILGKTISFGNYVIKKGNFIFTGTDKFDENIKLKPPSILKRDDFSYRSVVVFAESQDNEMIMLESFRRSNEVRLTVLKNKKACNS
ncbi:MAG: hypothetical protein PHO93_01410 [Candidatus Saccharimonadaceae bacterium]|nr:hypothetical protein [Candidatus Saccharimonadaceae bacterium]